VPGRYVNLGAVQARHGGSASFGDEGISPHWLEDCKGKVHQNGENNAASRKVVPLLVGGAGPDPAAQADSPDGLAEIYSVLDRHQPPLSEEMRLLLILRENTMLWEEVA
jgi:hypothetical protein